MRVKEFLDQVVRRLNELDPDAPEHWGREELRDHLNDGLNELNLIAGEYQASAAVAINSTDHIYALADTVIAPLSVYYNGRALAKETVEGLDREGTWELASTRLNPRRWAAFGLTKIIIYPRPTVPGNATVESLVRHDVVDDETDEINAREEYLPCIEDYVVFRAFVKEGGNEFVQMQTFYQSYLQAVQKLSGLNIARRYPAWAVAPEAQTSESGGRRSVKSQ